jgi:tRNA (uracil-5-)-methyltransferase TRM9
MQETRFVHDTYSEISRHFDETRKAIWKGVARFLDVIPAYSVVGDFGCGNGKYTRYRPDVFVIASDMCAELLDVIPSSGSYDRIRMDGTRSALREDSLDFAISIAVVHHIQDMRHRRAFLQHMIRSVRSTGRVLFTVWAAEQFIKPKWVPLGNNDYHIPWTDKYTKKTIQRYYHLFTKDEVEELISGLEDVATYTMEYEDNNWYVTIQTK